MCYYKKIYLKQILGKQNQTTRLISSDNISPWSWLLMKQLNILNVCQIKILQQLLLMLKIKSSIIPRTLNQISIFFFYLDFLSLLFTIHRTAEEGKFNSLTPHYHFHRVHRHLDISWVSTTDSSPLDIVSSRTRTGSL